MSQHPSLKTLTHGLAAAGVFCAFTFGANAQAQSSGTAGKKRAASADAVTMSDLAKKLDALEKQNAALQAKVEKLEAAQTAQTAQAVQVQQQTAQVQQQAAQVQQQTAQVQQQATKVQQQAAQVAAQTQVVEAKAQGGGLAGSVASWAASTTVSAYGEIGYTHPTKSPKDTNVDVQRAVIGMQHQFDDRTKMVAEWEWEHAITSADDRGESEVEQLWLEREFTPALRGRVGLFLMPVGLINQNHEPTAYYGVYRPDVDTKIVPSTWREVGLGINGDTPVGVNYDFALTTAPNLGKWDPASTEGRDRGPLQAIHGEGQFAAARNLGVVGALNWRGVPGLLLGGSVVYDSIGQNQPGFLGNGSKLLMLDVHGRYQIAGLDFAGEFIRGTISHTEALNTSYATSAVTSPTLVPHLFYGGYGQVAYNLFRSGDYRLVPFARYEVLNTAAGFGNLAVAAGGVKQRDEHIATAGASLYIGEGIVLKADYRHYRNAKQPDAIDHFTLGNSFNLGAGFAF